MSVKILKSLFEQLGANELCALVRLSTLNAKYEKSCGLMSPLPWKPTAKSDLGSIALVADLRDALSDLHEIWHEHR